MFEEQEEDKTHTKVRAKEKTLGPLAFQENTHEKELRINAQREEEPGLVLRKEGKKEF